MTPSFNNPKLISIASGLFSAGLFLLIYGFGLGVIFMLLPALPLLMTGLSSGLRPLSLATLAGGVALMLITGLDAAQFYFGFIAFPCLLFAPLALQRRDGDFVPIGEVLTDVSVYGALVMVAVIVHFSPDGGLQALAVEQIGKSFEKDAQTAAAVQAFAGQWLFLALGISACWWVLLLYLHAYMAQALLGKRGAKARDSIELQPFNVPLLLLGALGLAAAFTFSAQPDVALAARTVLIIFLLPYFLLGISILHQRAKTWPGRGVFLFLLYFATLTLAWPALAIAGIGLWRQLQSLKPFNPKT